MKKVKTSLSAFLVHRLLERANELSVVVCCESDDLDYAEVTLFGENAEQLRDEIESGEINLKL